MAGMPLPTIDLREGQSAAAATILEACGRDGPGFFFLRMPPEHQESIDALIAATRWFFSSAHKRSFTLENMRVFGRKVPDTGPGFRGLGEDKAFAMDTRESFNISRGYSLWPGPVKGTPFHLSVERCFTLLEELAARLRSVIALALGREATALDHMFGGPTPTLLGFVRYAPVRSDVASGVMGIRPHQDDGLFTLLATDGQPGLQILRSWSGTENSDKWVTDRSDMQGEEAEWIDVPHRRGYYLVNLGTAMQRVARGRLRATLHRVVNRQGVERFSVPFFYEPRVEARLELETELGQTDAETFGSFLLGNAAAAAAL